MKSIQYPQCIPEAFSLSIMFVGGKEEFVNKIKKEINIPDTVFIEATIPVDSDSQDWNDEAMKMSDIIIFIEDGAMNDLEFGRHLESNKVIYVIPNGEYEGDISKKYLDQIAKTGRNKVYQPRTVEDVVNNVNEVNERFNLNKEPRVGANRYIPMHIWGTAQFQEWYGNLIKAGNRIDDANLQYHLMKRGNIFIFSLHVDIWVSKENRHKGNEVILSRRSVSSIMAYSDKHVVLIKEFRSPVSNDEGFVYELAGGSSFDNSVNPLVDACEEFYEEVGIRIEDINRFEKVETRQMAATLSTHRCHLYKLKLTEEEIGEILKIKEIKDRQTVILDDHEHTYIEVVEKDKVATLPMDFATLGMILSSL